MNYNEYVKKLNSTKFYKRMKDGTRYYEADNTGIMEREKKIYAGEFGIVANPFMANHKLPSSYLKLIIDQKVQYLFGNGVDFENDESIDEYFDDPFDEVVIDLGVNTSQKAVSWLYAYKESGKLKFTLVPSNQLFPKYDEMGRLSEMIRSYQDGDQQVILVYDKNGMKKYLVEKDQDVLKDDKGHYEVLAKYNKKTVAEESKAFTQVPFIPFYNNGERLTDLKRIKPLIDMYDITNSDFANNIDDMQDAFFTLKGFDASITELQKFMNQLKQTKAAGIPADGELGVNQLQVPVEARETLLNRLNKDIFKYSMAVDMDGLTGGSITNVMILAMFANLDLKCDQFESEFRKFMRKLIKFINENDNKSLIGDFELNRSLIINKGEDADVRLKEVDALVKLIGTVSDKTIIENLPYDIDTQEELKRIADNKAINPIGLGSE